MTAKILEGCLCILNSDYWVAVYNKKAVSFKTAFLFF